MFASPASRSLSRAVAVATTTAALLLTASCGDEKAGDAGDTGDTATSTTVAGSTTVPTTPTWSDPTAGTREGAPTITAPTTPAPTELKIEDPVPGTGAEAGEGDVVLVDYVGANYSDGKVFDASFGRAPFPVLLGTGSVIPGWDKGLLGMKAGGTRQLTIPPDLAYGEQGSGDIPPNETLIFVIQLHAVMERPEVEPVPGGTATELEITDLAPGTGEATAAEGSTVSVHYVGVHGADGKQFDASWDGGRPIDVTLGQGQVIEGWEQGLLGMKLGGRRRIVIPADLAYGDAGQPPIEPGETLVFVVDLVGLTP